LIKFVDTLIWLLEFRSALCSEINNLTFQQPDYHLAMLILLRFMLLKTKCVLS